METNRRNWLKQVGIGFAGLGLTQLEMFATPATGIILSGSDTLPILLRSNENPYGPSPLARTAMTDNIHASNRYGWELTSELISLIAKENHVNADQILMGAGSTEILDITVRYAALQKGSFILAEPTFNYWTDLAQRSGLTKIAILLSADKKHDLNAMLQAIQPDTRLIYICNPNNPSGTLCDRDALISFVKEATKTTLVLLDEAYLDFTQQESLSAMVIDNKNLVIAKTFSKIYGLAGCRVGYAIANPATIKQISEMQFSANGSISVLSAAAAMASLKDKDFVKDTYMLNEKVRKYTIEQLEHQQITCIPSQTNFVYFSLSNYKKDFFEQLKNNNIQGTKIYEETGKWSRITIGTQQEMEKFISSIA
jgi:histidinol-phosphate aminotransferase